MASTVTAAWRRVAASCRAAGWTDALVEARELHAGLAGQPEGVLPCQHAAAMVVHLGLCQFAVVDGFHQRVHLFLDAAGHKQHVAPPALQCLQAQRAGSAHALHGQRVGEHKSAEAPGPGASSPVTTAWESEEGRFASGSMAGTDRCPTMMPPRPAFYDVAEGKKLYRVEPLAAEIEGGQRLVGVDLRVAMPGEVLGHGEHSAPLQPLSVSSRCAGLPAGGCSPNERVPITGLRGLMLTSATGAKLTCTPSSRNCRATSRPYSVRRLSLVMQPSTMLRG